MVVDCGVRIVSVSSSLEATLSNTTLSAFKGHSYLVQSCLEVGWLGRTEGVCLSVFGSVQSWCTVKQEGVRDNLYHLHSIHVGSAF